MVGARSYKYSGGSNAAERLHQVPNLACNSKHQSGLHIQHSFHLCIFNLLNVIVQSTMETFRWQIGKKRSKLTLNTTRPSGTFLDPQGLYFHSGFETTFFFGTL